MIVALITGIVAVCLWIAWGITSELIYGIISFGILGGLICFIYLSLMASHMRVASKSKKDMEKMVEITNYHPEILRGEFSVYERHLSSMLQIKGLEYAKNVEILSLGKNNFTKIENLNNCKNAKTLLLANCQIEKIEGLDKLTNLRTLDLSNNKITTIEGLGNLSNLEKLILTGNPIVWPPGLSEQSSAQEIVAYCRKLKSKAPIKKSEPKIENKPAPKKEEPPKIESPKKVELPKKEVPKQSVTVTSQDPKERLNQLIKLVNDNINSGNYDEAFNYNKEAMGVARKMNLPMQPYEENMKKITELKAKNN